MYIIKALEDLAEGDKVILVSPFNSELELIIGTVDGVQLDDGTFTVEELGFDVSLQKIAVLEE